MSAASGKRRVAGKVFVISSPSGGGKTTVVEKLRRQIPRLARSISATTRPPRAGEKAGRDYRFISQAHFKALIKAGKLLEWAKVHGAFYGTPRQPVIKSLNRGSQVVLSIDVQGGRQIRRKLGKQAVLVFLMPPSLRQLRARLTRRRADGPEAIARRLSVAKKETACARWYDYRVANGRLEKVVDRVKSIIQSEVKQRRQHGTGGD